MRLDGEYLGFHDLVQRLYTDDEAGGGRLTARGLELLDRLDPQRNYVGPLAPAEGLIIAGRREMTREFMKWLALVEAEFARPLWRPDAGSFAREIRRLESSRVFTNRYPPIARILPALARLGRQPKLATQERDALSAAIALELFRRRTGFWPEALEELVPELLPAVPHDCFDGGRLRYRLTGGRPVLYSVGADRDDDEGRPARDAGGRYDPVRASLVDDEGEPVTDGDWILWPIGAPDALEPDAGRRAGQSTEKTPS